MSGAAIRIDLQDPPTDEADLIWAGLKAHNIRVAGRPEPKPFALILREGEALRGGIKATVHWDVLFVDQVWIDDALQRRGIGTELMRRAEAEGRARGAAKAILDTNDWQARPFYERLGYRAFGEYAYDEGRKTCFLMMKEPLAP